MCKYLTRLAYSMILRNEEHMGRKTKPPKGNRTKPSVGGSLEIKDNELVIEIDGENASPEKINAKEALIFFYNSIEAIERIASEFLKEKIEFTGLRIIDKCIAAVVGVSDSSIAKVSAMKAIDLVKNPERAPLKIRKTIHNLEESARKLVDLKQAPSIFIGPSEPQKLLLPFTSEPQLLPASVDDNISIDEYTETTTFRAYLDSIGGEDPKARFRQKINGKDVFFELKMAKQKDIAKNLAKFLYSEIEIHAQVNRELDGLIKRGEILSFYEVKQTDPQSFIKKLRELHQKTNWAEVETTEELLKELGRGD